MDTDALNALYPALALIPPVEREDVLATLAQAAQVPAGTLLFE